MLNVVILGSTGSLGIQTLEILEKYQTHFKIIGLSSHKNTKLLETQAKKFHVKNLAFTAKELQKLATLKTADLIVNVLSGTAGIAPTLAALKANKVLLLGNKESLVAEGEKVIKLATSNKRLNALIPIDSEHNAIFEILQNLPAQSKIKQIILPCSGGPFLQTFKSKLNEITPIQALNHPSWQMGQKISIESATLLNKGLEIIEAHYLFSMPLEKITIKIHPQCQIHGAVEISSHVSAKRERAASVKNLAPPVLNRASSKNKGKTTTLGYISKPDMKEHIENALLRAASLKTSSYKKIHPLTKTELKSLKAPQLSLHQKLPGIKIILNYFKNHQTEMKKFLLYEEKIIQKFLSGRIKFTEIFSELQKF